MAYVETTSEPDALTTDGHRTVPVALQLEVDVHELMGELMRRTGLGASELVGWALGAYWREMEGIVLPPVRHEHVRQVLAESEADIAAGRVSTNDEVFDRLAAKHGW